MFTGRRGTFLNTFCILRDLSSWKEFKECCWLLHADSPQLKNVLQRYESKLTYFMQEVKFLAKASTHVSFRTPRVKRNSIAIVNSKNQRTALRELVKILDLQEVSFEIETSGKKLKLTVSDLFLVGLILIINARRLRSILSRKYYYHHLKTFLYAIMVLRGIDLRELNYVFVANDHLPESRIFLFFQKKHSFKLIYKQHAQVSEYFPPLVWDHSILDGAASRDVYQKIEEPKGQVWTIGSDKTSDLVSARSDFNFSKIGIALNTLDNLQDLALYLNRVRDVHGINKFLVRPHPGFMHKDWFRILKECVSSDIDIVIHRGDLVNFLKDISVCIAGSSSILLEAAIARKLCVQHTFVPEHLLDYYHFLERGLAISHEALLKIRCEKFDAIHFLNVQSTSAKYFSESLNTSFEGKELDKLALTCNEIFTLSSGNE